MPTHGVENPSQRKHGYYYHFKLFLFIYYPVLEGADLYKISSQPPESEVESSFEPTTPVKRGRGRPKKNTRAASASADKATRHGAITTSHTILDAMDSLNAELPEDIRSLDELPRLNFKQLRDLRADCIPKVSAKI